MISEHEKFNTPQYCGVTLRWFVSRVHYYTGHEEADSLFDRTYTDAEREFLSHGTGELEDMLHGFVKQYRMLYNGPAYRGYCAVKALAIESFLRDLDHAGVLPESPAEE